MNRVFWSLIVCIALFGESAVAQTTGVGNSSATAQAGGFGSAPAAPAGPQANPLFDAIDADGDGTITTRELRKAVAALKRFDADRDGKITRAETLNNFAAAPSSSAAVGGGAQGGFGNGGGLSGDPRPGGPDMRQFDRNGDGQLSADEMPTQMRGMMRGADLNGDGRLDASEIANMQQRMNERVRGGRPLPPGVSIGPQGVGGVK